MTRPADLERLQPDLVLDGGDLDCGSGLVLLLRDSMLRVPVGGVLEMRSREPTVRDDLPPWCRMVGHELLGELPGEGCARYLIRRGAGSPDDERSLEADKERAKAYEWRLRARSTGPMRSTVYFRNHSLELGQPASFEERDERPSGVETLLAALAGSLATGFATECAREGLALDDVEISVRGALGNVLAHLGMEEGDPGLARIELKCFASTFDDEATVRAAWERTVARSPVAATLARAVALETKLAIV
jgi:uncharacterized OsmC-like protein/TusA-related sulfurtransferase